MKQFKSKLKFVDFISNKVPMDEKCLLFANTTEQADNICRHSHHSKNNKVENAENLAKFASGDITRLSAVEQLSEGITIPRLKHIVIMHSYGNEKKASQKIGRALRLNKDEVANVHVLCFKNTVDETWVAKSLEDFDISKIKWIDWGLQQGQFVKL
jgi:superfamily II DNA or RNA helicase